MKQFLGKALEGGLANSLQSSIASIRETAASSVSKWNPQSNETPSVTNQTSKPPREYLRLPVDSARKLRWFDKGDIASIVKGHLQEKRELNETIASLKLALMRQKNTPAHGHDGNISSSDPSSPPPQEDQQDGELQQLEDRAEDIRENDEGVAGVLLESCLTSIQELRDELHSLKQHPAPHGSIDMGSTGAKGVVHQGLPIELVQDLQESIRAAEEAMEASFTIHRKLRAQEVELRFAEVASNMEERVRVGEEGGGEGLVSSLSSKVSLLEAEQRAREEELAELHEQLRRALRDSKTQAEAQETSIISLKATIQGLKQDLESAEELAEKRAMELKKMHSQSQNQMSGPSLEAVRKIQESCLTAEERAATAERRLGLIEARLSKSESSLKEAHAQCKALNRQLEVSDSERRLALDRASEQETASALAASQSKANSAALEEAERKLHEVKEEAWAVQSALEARLSAADSREASLISELRDLELVSHERDALSIQVTALRDKISDQKDDRAQVDHLRGVVKELEESRSRVHEELVVTAQLVTQLESRLRAALAERDERGMEASASEMRAREAEASVGREVEERLASACASRALWPRPIREEVDRLEQRLAGLQASLSSAQDRMSSDSELQVTLLSNLEASKSRIRDLEASSASSASLIHTLELTLEARVEDLRVRTERLEDCEEAIKELKRQLSAASKAIMASSSSGRGGKGGLGVGGQPSASASASAMGHSKWQVQNKVGGGGWIEPQGSHTSLTGEGPGSSGGGPGGGEVPGLRRGGSSQTFDIVPLYSYPPEAGGGGGGGTRPSITSSGSSGLMVHPDFSPGSSTPINPRRGLGRNQASSPSPFSSPAPAPASVTANQPSSSAPLSPYKMEGVDIVYLKNVLLKFLEASMAGKVAERDVLLPAVAALLQVSPSEFKLLKKVTSNTTDPAAMQLMSAATSTANSIYNAFGWSK